MNTESTRSVAIRRSKPSPWVRVREARKSDIPAMSDLLGLLFSQEADFHPDAEKQQRALALLMAQPTLGRLFVVTRGKQILGMVSLLLTISTASGGKAAW